MLCAELEELEAQFDDIIIALEKPNLTDAERQALLLENKLEQIEATDFIMSSFDWPDA